jgi:hypothetical protein
MGKRSFHRSAIPCLQKPHFYNRKRFFLIASFFIWKKPLPEISPRAAIKTIDLQAWEVDRQAAVTASEKNLKRRYKKSLFAGMGC